MDLLRNCGKPVFRHAVKPHVKADCSRCSSSSSNSYIVSENLARSENIRTRKKTFRNLPAQPEHRNTEPQRLGELLSAVMENIKTHIQQNQKRESSIEYQESSNVSRETF